MLRLAPRSRTEPSFQPTSSEYLCNDQQLWEHYYPRRHNYRHCNLSLRLPSRKSGSRRRVTLLVRYTRTHSSFIRAVPRLENKTLEVRLDGRDTLSCAKPSSRSSANSRINISECGEHLETQSWPMLTPSAWIAKVDIYSQCAYTAAPVSSIHHEAQSLIC